MALTKEEEVRTQRNNLLSRTDYRFLPDLPLSEGEEVLLVSYRQALRDVPEQETFPDIIDWPVEPFEPAPEPTEGA